MSSILIHPNISIEVFDKLYKDENHYTLLKRKSKKGNTYYYYCYTPDGKRVLRGTGTKTRADALQVINKRIAENKLVYPDGMAIRPHSSMSGVITFGQYFADAYIPGKCPMMIEAEIRGKRPTLTTMANLRSHMPTILRRFGDIRLRDITSSMIDEWFISLVHQEGYAKSSANVYLNQLKQMLDYAVRHGEISVNPASSVERLKADAPTRRAFSEDEITRLFALEWSSPLAKLACLLSAVTGMRMGEVLAVKTSSIKDGYILVNASISSIDGEKSTKSGKAREVPIGKKLEKMLLDFAPAEGYIFSKTGKKPVSADTIRRLFFVELAKLGVPDPENLTFHSFRHYANTKLVAANINAEKVRAVIGHASESMTEHYLHLKADDLKEIQDVQASIMEKLLEK